MALTPRLVCVAAFVGACASVGPPAAPPAPRAASSSPREARAPEPSAVPAAPPKPALNPAAQAGLLASLEGGCQGARNYDHPDVMTRQCHEAQVACLARLPELRAMAEGAAATPELRARALEIAAMLHAFQRCGREPRVDPCEIAIVDADHPLPSDLCPSLAWVHAALARAAMSADGPVLVAAAEGLRMARGEPTVVVPVLRSLLAAVHPEAPGPDGSMSAATLAAAAAAAAFIHYPDHSPEALPELTTILLQRADFVHEPLVLGALMAVSLMGAGAEPAKQLVIIALKDARPRVRAAAAQALGGMGDAAKDALGPLTARKSDTSLEVRQAAEHAIMRIQIQGDPFGF